MRSRCHFLIVICLLLAACDAPVTPSAAPTRVLPNATEAAAAQTTPSETTTLPPTPKPSSSPTRTPPPTATRRPHTATPSPTLFPSPAFTPIPYLDPTATPLPDAQTITASSIGQLTELYRLGNGVLNDVQWSPDGRWLGAATGLGVYLYDANTLELARFIDAGEYVNAIAFSPNGNRVATGGESVQIWLTETGEANSRLDGRFEGGVLLMGWSPDGATIFAEGKDSTGCCGASAIYRVWNAADGRLLYSTNELSFLSSFAFSPDGQRLAGSPTYGGIWVRDARSFELIWAIETRLDIAYHLEYSPDGTKLIASEGEAFASVMYDAADGEQLQLIHGAYEFAVLPNGQHLTIIVEDDPHTNSILIWDMVNSQQSGRFAIPGSQGPCNDINVSPSGKTAACFDPFRQSNAIVIFDWSTGRLIREMEFSRANSDSLAFGSNPRSSGDFVLAVGSNAGDVQVFEAQSGNPLTSWIIEHDGIEILAFSPDGRTLAASSGGGVIHSFDATTGNEFPPLIIDQRTIGLAFSKDGQALLVDGGARRIAWDWTTHQPIDDPLSQDWQTQGNILINPQGHLIDLAWSEDFLPYPRNEVTGEALGLPAEQSWCDICSAALSYDGNFLILGTEMGDLWLWDLRTKDVPRLLGQHETTGWDGGVSGVEDVAFSPYNDLLASAGYDGKIMLWNPATGSLVRTIPFYGPAYALAFSPDGRLLAVASGDGAVHVFGISP